MSDHIHYWHGNPNPALTLTLTLTLILTLTLTLTLALTLTLTLTLTLALALALTLTTRGVAAAGWLQLVDHAPADPWERQRQPGQLRRPWPPLARGDDLWDVCLTPIEPRTSCSQKA